MIVLAIVVVGLIALTIIFAPEFIVGLMKLTIIAAISYIITTSFMRKEMGYLIIILYWFAIITMGAQFIAPHAQNIKANMEKIKQVQEKVDRVERVHDWINFGAPKSNTPGCASD